LRHRNGGGFYVQCVLRNRSLGRLHYLLEVNHMNKFQHLAAKRRSDEGFTLIELLMVVVIMGILAGIVVFSIKGINDRGEASACKTEVSTIDTAEEAAYAQDSTYYDLTTLATKGFLHGTTPKYVASVDTATGAVKTLTADAPAGCTAG
jgi:general secretion pathway protein G